MDQNTDDQENGVNVSAVVAASFVGEQLRNLTDDVLITINLGTSNYSNVTCVSWDFNALGMYLYTMIVCLVREEY